jgi:preprotein translocase subunit SecE
MNSLLVYFRESLQELHQVRWPTRQQALRLTGVVLVFLAISSLAFGAVDAVIGQILRSTFNLF